MKTVILYGELAKRFGREHKFQVRNPAEALRALKANFKGFESYMSQAHKHNTGFKVFTGRQRLNDYKEIHYPIIEEETIRIVPVFVGSGAWTRILIGVVLIAAAVVWTFLSDGAGAPNGAIQLGALGVAMIVGGVAQLLTTPPKLQEMQQADRRNSYVFNGPLNTSAQGQPVPIGYGEMIVGSVVISAGIETHEIY